MVNDTNKTSSFLSFPEDLKKTIHDLENTYKIVTIDKNNDGIVLNIDAFKQFEQEIYNNYNEIETKFLKHVFELLQKNPHRFMPNQAILNHFYYYFPLEKSTLVSTTTATREESPREKISDTSEVSGGHSILNLSALYRYLEEKKWEYCVWISKTDRDHNLNPIGWMDPRGLAFGKLEQGLGLTFSNANGWETVVGSRDGLYFSWSINKNGYIRFWINEKLSWELFFKLLQEKLKRCDLTTKEFKEIIECLEDEDRKKLFYLETANMIGPREVIERDFNKACLIYKKVYFDGLYLPVLVQIDKSKGPHEIEYKGVEGPTRRVQDITSRAVEVVESIGVLDFKLDSELQLNLSNNELLQEHGESLKTVETGLEQLQQQVVLKDEFKIEATELEGQLLNLFVQNDVYQLEQRTHFTNLLKASLKNAKTSQLNAENITDLIKTLEREFPELKSNIERIVYDNIEPIVSGQQLICKKIENVDKKIENLHDDMKQQFKSFKILIEQEFETNGTAFRSTCELLMQAIKQNPEITIKGLTIEIKKKRNISKNTLCKYLNILRDRELISSDTRKKNEKGRPLKIFKLTQKINDYVKNLKKN